MGKKREKKEPQIEDNSLPIDIDEIIEPTDKTSLDLIFNNKPDDIDKSIQERTLEKALDELFSTDDIDLKTDINNAQISAISRGYIFADTYKCKPMGDLIRHILELSVSKNREGRKEFVKIMNSSYEDPEEKKLKLIRRRLIGD